MGLKRVRPALPSFNSCSRCVQCTHEKNTIENYAIVGEALLWTLEKGLAADFTPEVKDAWATVYGILAQTAIDAAYAPGEPVPVSTGNAQKAEPSLAMKMEKPTREEVIAHLQTNKDLIGLNLSGLNLRGVNMVGANLTGANLAYAELTGASLVDLHRHLHPRHEPVVLVEAEGARDVDGLGPLLDQDPDIPLVVPPPRPDGGVRLRNRTFSIYAEPVSSVRKSW